MQQNFDLLGMYSNLKTQDAMYILIGTQIKRYHGGVSLYKPPILDESHTTSEPYHLKSFLFLNLNLRGRDFNGKVPVNKMQAVLAMRALDSGFFPLKFPDSVVDCRSTSLFLAVI